MYARPLICVGLALVTFYALLVILWAVWFVVFDVMVQTSPNVPDWVGTLALVVAILSGLALYFLAVWWEVSLVMKCPASQAKGLVALSGALPLLTFAALVWYIFKDWNVLSSY